MSNLLIHASYYFTNEFAINHFRLRSYTLNYGIYFLFFLNLQSFIVLISLFYADIYLSHVVQ